MEQLVSSKTVEALVARAISYVLLLRHDEPVLLLEDPGALSKEEREFLMFIGAVPVDEEEERDLGVAARFELVIERKPQLHNSRRRDDFAASIRVDHAGSSGIVDGDPGPVRSFTRKGDALSVENDEVLTGETEPFQTRDAHLVERLDEEDEGYGVKLVAGVAQPERDLNEGKVHQSMGECTPGHGEFGCRHDLSLIHISEPTRLGMISYAVFCLKKKKKKNNKTQARQPIQQIKQKVINMILST